MRTIHKHYVRPSSTPLLFRLPHNWRPLHFAYQGADTALWVEVDTDQPLEDVHLLIFGTGHDIPTNASWLWTAVGPVYVWHLYMMLR